MKALILSLLLLSACSTAPKRAEREYECAILTHHGIQAKGTVMASYREEAEEIAEKDRLELVKEGQVGSNTFVMCYEKE